MGQYPFPSFGLTLRSWGLGDCGVNNRAQLVPGATRPRQKAVGRWSDTLLCGAERGGEAPAVLLAQLGSGFLLWRLGLGIGRHGGLANSVVERGFGILVVNDERHDGPVADLHSHLTPPPYVPSTSSRNL